MVYSWKTKPGRAEADCSPWIVGAKEQEMEDWKTGVGRREPRIVRRLNPGAPGFHPYLIRGYKLSFALFVPFVVCYSPSFPTHCRTPEKINDQNTYSWVNPSFVLGSSWVRPGLQNPKKTGGIHDV
jgi:hypothetical protein